MSKAVFLISFLFVFADFIHKITVQASPGLEKRRNSPDLGSGSSPSFGPRFRAIQREYGYFLPQLGHTQICLQMLEEKHRKEWSSLQNCS